MDRVGADPRHDQVRRLTADELPTEWMLCKRVDTLDCDYHPPLAPWCVVEDSGTVDVTSVRRVSALPDIKWQRPYSWSAALLWRAEVQCAAGGGVEMSIGGV